MSYLICLESVSTTGWKQTGESLLSRDTDMPTTLHHACVGPCVIMIESCDTNNNKRRWRDSSTSGIGQRWYRCTERGLGAHVHMHMVSMWL